MSHAPRAQTPESPTDGSPEKYLTFMVADDEYGVPIVRVREIIGLMPITAVPEAPHSIRGVINLRGRVIPVMDLRRRFQIDGDAAELDRACIIVAEVRHNDSLVDLGLLVDTVREVFSLDVQHAHSGDNLQSTIEQSCIAGLANDESGIKILINVDSLLTPAQLGLSMFDSVGGAASWDARSAAGAIC